MTRNTTNVCTATTHFFYKNYKVGDYCKCGQVNYMSQGPLNLESWTRWASNRRAEATRKTFYLIIGGKKPWEL